MRIVLDLSDDDLKYYQQVMEAVWRRNAKRAEKELVDGARRLLHQATKQNAPEYVQKRLEDLAVLVDMLDDPEWPLEEQDRRRIVAAVGYFAVPKDMIPDKIPGLGFLDDALMAELVIRELKPELDGYRDFCKYRDNEAELRGRTKVSREDWLAAKRRQIWYRIRRRQQESRLSHASNEWPTPPILRYHG
ncbi:MAG TPA: YkvA family protein [Gammaproteobacteria bacterium]